MIWLRFIAVSVVLALSLPGLSFAQNAPVPEAKPAAVAVDPKAREFAQQLVKLIDTRRVMESMFGAVSKNIIPVLARDNPGKSEEAQKIYSDAIQRAMLNHMDQIEANTVDLYAQNYSADELQQIVSFYKSPVGQKVLTTMPAMMQKSVAMNMPIIQTAVREALTDSAGQLQKSGLNVPKEIKAQPGAQ